MADDLTGTYFAMCTDCRPLLPMPFGSITSRDEWVSIHEAATSHRVVIGRDDVDWRVREANDGE